MTPPRPRRKRPISLRMKTLLVGVAATAALGVVVVGGTALLVNNLKNELLEESRRQAEASAAAATERIESILRERETERLEDVIGHPEVQSQLRILTREGGVVLVGLFDAQGRVLLELPGQGREAITVDPSSGKRVGFLDKDAGLTWELSSTRLPEGPVGARRARTPVTSAGQTVGYIQYDISESQAVGRLYEIGTRISAQLGAMVAAVVLLLLVSFALLYKVFRRHLQLQLQNDAAQHLAHIGTLASGLAHEIRNPLHAMNLHLEAAREELEEGDGPAAQQRTLAIVGNVQRQIEALNNSLNGFLTYAIPKNLENEALRIDLLVHEVAAFLRPEFDRRQVSLAIETQDDLHVLADQTAVRQILTNILLNAVQVLEGRDRREVRVVLGESRGMGTVTIEDTGPGLPPGEEEQIFEVFHSRRKGGSGLGLSVARRLTEGMGGTLTGETREEGGARFVLSLPIAEGAAHPRAARRAVEA